MITYDKIIAYDKGFCYCKCEFEDFNDYVLSSILDMNTNLLILPSIRPVNHVKYKIMDDLR